MLMILTSKPAPLGEKVYGVPPFCRRAGLRSRLGPGPHKIFSKKQYVGCVEGRRRGSPQSCWEPQRSQWTHVAKPFIVTRKNRCVTICPKNLCYQRDGLLAQNAAVKSTRHCYNDAPTPVILNALVTWGYWKFILDTSICSVKCFDIFLC